MSHNSFGQLFRVTTWGESHGQGVGCVIDGCPPRLPLSEKDLQPWLDRRRPGQSIFTTQRRELDQVSISSGVFQGVTTGTPISLQIRNIDHRSHDYSTIRDAYRPGHADLVYDLKYGVRDYRGGGRSSARETAARVAAGGVARRVLGDGIRIRGALVQIGNVRIDRTRWDWASVDNNPLFCPDPAAAIEFQALLAFSRKSGSSVGAVIEITAEGVPPGLGAPVYGKLDADLAAALMSINAVKGVEIGEGFATAALAGEDNADEMRIDDGNISFNSNHSGGVLGGISSGEPVTVRFAVKPTSSILVSRHSVDRDGREIQVSTPGRHDPCVGIRAIPVGEAMIACVLADHLLRHRAQNPNAPTIARLPLE